MGSSSNRVNATTGIPRRSNPYMGKLATHLPSAAQAEASILAASTAPWPPRPWNLISVADISLLAPAGRRAAPSASSFFAISSLQRRLVQLLRRRVRHGLHELDALRQLPAPRPSLPRRKAMTASKVSVAPGRRLDVGADPLSHERVGHGDDRHHGHIRVLVDEALDHGGADALAAPVDHLLEAAGEPDVAVLVDDGQVAGLEEAVLVEDLGVLLGVLVVAGEDGRALEQELALACRAAACCRRGRPPCRCRAGRSGGPPCRRPSRCRPRPW